MGDSLANFHPHLHVLKLAKDAADIISDVLFQFMWKTTCS